MSTAKVKTLATEIKATETRMQAAGNTQQLAFDTELQVSADKVETVETEVKTAETRMQTASNKQQIVFDAELRVSAAKVETLETKVKTYVHAIEVATKRVQGMQKYTVSFKDAAQAANKRHIEQAPEQEGISEAIENILSPLTSQLNTLNEGNALLQQSMQDAADMTTDG